MKHVADTVGVSTSAVSVALGGGTGGTRVSEATRKRIVEAAKDIGYHSDPVARTLRGGRSNTIGVLWPLGHSEGMAGALALRIWRRGFATQMVDSLSDPAVVCDSLDTLARWRSDGVVLHTKRHLLNNPEITKRLNTFESVVLVTDEPVQSAFNLVAMDRPRAVVEVVDYLVATGRTRLCMLTGSGEANRSKIEPFLARLKHHGLPTTDALLQAHRPARASDSLAYFREALVEQFPTAEGGFPYDAVIGSNDEAAGAALLHLRELGLRVPEDVALIGGNDADMAQLTDPPLASIAFNVQKTVAAVECLLFKRFGQPDAPAEQVTVPLHFIWRASAGPSPACSSKATRRGDHGPRLAFENNDHESQGV